MRKKNKRALGFESWSTGGTYRQRLALLGTVGAVGALREEDGVTSELCLYVKTFSPKWFVYLCRVFVKWKHRMDGSALCIPSRLRNRECVTGWSVVIVRSSHSIRASNESSGIGRPQAFHRSLRNDCVT